MPLLYCANILMKRNLNSVCFSWSAFLQAGIVFDVFQTPTLFRRFQRLFFAAVRPALLVCPSYWQEGGGKDQVKRQIYCPENVPTARLTGKTIVQKTKTKILVIEMKFIIHNHLSFQQSSSSSHFDPNLRCSAMSRRQLDKLGCPNGSTCWRNAIIKQSLSTSASIFS